MLHMSRPVSRVFLCARSRTCERRTRGAPFNSVFQRLQRQRKLTWCKSSLLHTGHHWSHCHMRKLIFAGRALYRMLGRISTPMTIPHSDFTHTCLGVQASATSVKRTAVPNCTYISLGVLPGPSICGSCYKALAKTTHYFEALR